MIESFVWNMDIAYTKVKQKTKIGLYDKRKAIITIIIRIKVDLIDKNHKFKKADNKIWWDSQKKNSCWVKSPF